MAKSRKNRAISQRNDVTSINNKKGKARRAKRNASKKERRDIKKETNILETKTVNIWLDEEQVWCPTCGAPHESVRPGKTQPTCICDAICEACGGRKAMHACGEDPEYPNMMGEWCPRCGPFALINGGYRG